MFRSIEVFEAPQCRGTKRMTNKHSPIRRVEVAAQTQRRDESHLEVPKWLIQQQTIMTRQLLLRHILVNILLSSHHHRHRPRPASIEEGPKPPDSPKLLIALETTRARKGIVIHCYIRHCHFHRYPTNGSDSILSSSDELEEPVRGAK